MSQDYIVDNELILSGANLSEEYFTNRLDRYMSFVNGGAGLVNFYADLCDVLCKYAFEYKGQRHDNAKMSKLFVSDNDSVKKKELEQSLMQLFNGEKQDSFIRTSIPVQPSHWRMQYPPFRCREHSYGGRCNFILIQKQRGIYYKPRWIMIRLHRLDCQVPIST